MSSPVTKNSLQPGLIPVLGFPGGIHDFIPTLLSGILISNHTDSQTSSWNGKTGLWCSSRCVLNRVHFVENRKIFLESVFAYSIFASLNTSHSSLAFQYLFSHSDTSAMWIPKQTNRNPTRSDHVLSAPGTFDGSCYL